MVVANMGVTLIPEIAASNNSVIKFLPFKKEINIGRNIALFWRNGSSKKLLTEKLLEIL